MAFNCWPFSKERVESSVIETQTVETDFPTPSSDLVIIDCGSSECRAGFSGEKEPRISIPTLVGRPKEGAAVGYRSNKNSYVGFEAQQMRAVLNINAPIERGIIKDWDDMETCYEYIFNEGVQIAPPSYGILLTETPNNPTRNREKLLELMLEKFNFKSFALVPAPPLALYAYGFHTGVVLDSGEGQTHIVPVYEGLSMHHSTRYIPLGGKDINELLANILARSGKATEFLQATGDKEFLRDIKETLCYVSFDYQEAFSSTKINSKSYRLPDGSYIKLNNELFRCTEALFEPTMLAVKTGGVHENLYRAIQLSDESIRHLLYDHIVLSGGNTLFPGFQERLAKEMHSMSEPDAKIRIHAKTDRKSAVFLGASLLSSLATFKNMMITYSEYFEVGPSIVNTKCF